MNARAKGSLAELLEAGKRGWVRVKSISWNKATMNVDIAIDARRNGPTRELWRLECKNVLEYYVCDVNGGGLAAYTHDHPVVSHLIDEVVSLSVRGKPKHLSRVMGDLLRAHEKAAGDWIAFDRYLASGEFLSDRLASGKGTLAKGPKFLMASYAAALRASGIGTRLTRTRAKKSVRATALHFGNSYVVARSFVAAPVSSPE